MPSENPPQAAVTDTDRLVRALRDPRCYPHETARIEVIETHISYVILTGLFAYKLKKPLTLPFLDFSTLERRRHFCEEELRLNRRLAPDLYLDVVPIEGDFDSPRIGTGSEASGETGVRVRGEPIEYAVKLRQFDPDATADRMLARGLLDRGAVERLAARIAAFHRAAPPGRGEPPGALAARNVAELDDALRKAGAHFRADDLAAFTDREAKRLAGLFDERARRGAVRECHGDLHLENVAMIGSELVPFDALEFDVAMRSMDVIDEVAFLVMDFTAHGSPDLAHAFLNRYLEETGDYPGTALLGFYLLYRALVRAKVRAIKASAANDTRQAAERIAPYLALARRLMQPVEPRLILTYGLSGSGKTTVTEELVPRLPAIRLRSDLERKRLVGIAPTTREELGVGEGRYDAATTARTYDALKTGADAALSGGLDVIVDATFILRERRAAFAELAARHGAQLAVLVCEAPDQTLRERIRRRAAAGTDASEATEAVLDAQLRHAEPPTAEEGVRIVRVDTTKPIDYDALVKRFRRRV